jgi:hypothetical protein
MLKPKSWTSPLALHPDEKEIRRSIGFPTAICSNPARLRLIEEEKILSRLYRQLAAFLGIACSQLPSLGENMSLVLNRYMQFQKTLGTMNLR